MLDRIRKFLKADYATAAAFTYVAFAFLYGGAGLLDYSLKLPGSLSSPVFDSSLLLKGLAIVLAAALAFLVWRAPVDAKTKAADRAADRKDGGTATSSR
ncbi:MAG: hypothetical protein HY047_09660 [Acidobacteria bacterium]|nr:hypothetical protein [Acidobacteriota bacterium]